MDLNLLGTIEERIEKYDGLGSVDCSVFYPDPELYQLETCLLYTSDAADE